MGWGSNQKLRSLSAARAQDNSLFFIQINFGARANWSEVLFTNITQTMMNGERAECSKIIIGI
jgi:hypothetical protein